jgi:hypothetical protein
MRSIFVKIGDVLPWIVAITRIGRSVQLPDVIKPENMVQRLIGDERAAFRDAVVHDGDPRFKGRERGGDIHIRAPMMGDEIGVRGTDEVLRTSKIEERLAGEIPDIEKAKLAVANDDSG